MNARKTDTPFVTALRLFAAAALVAGAIAVVVMCPWLILVAVCGSPLFLGVRKH